MIHVSNRARCCICFMRLNFGGGAAVFDISGDVFLGLDCHGRAYRLRQYGAVLCAAICDTPRIYLAFRGALAGEKQKISLNVVSFINIER